jgi:predicted dehydrogenase
MSKKFAPTVEATMVGCAPNWGPTIDRAYQADRANGANLLTITGGHTIDALCYCLGEFRELAAFVVSQRDRILVEETDELIAKTSPSGPRRHEQRHGVPARDPRGPGRPPANGHLTSLYAAAGTECEGGSR